MYTSGYSNHGDRLYEASHRGEHEQLRQEAGSRLNLAELRRREEEERRRRAQELAKSKQIKHETVTGQRTMTEAEGERLRGVEREKRAREEGGEGITGVVPMPLHDPVSTEYTKRAQEKAKEVMHKGHAKFRQRQYLDRRSEGRTVDESEYVTITAEQEAAEVRVKRQHRDFQRTQQHIAKRRREHQAVQKKTAVSRQMQNEPMGFTTRRHADTILETPERRTPRKRRVSFAPPTPPPPPKFPENVPKERTPTSPRKHERKATLSELTGILTEGAFRLAGGGLKAIAKGGLAAVVGTAKLAWHLSKKEKGEGWFQRVGKFFVPEEEVYEGGQLTSNLRLASSPTTPPTRTPAEYEEFGRHLDEALKRQTLIEKLAKEMKQNYNSEKHDSQLATLAMEAGVDKPMGELIKIIQENPQRFIGDLSNHINKQFIPWLKHNLQRGKRYASRITWTWKKNCRFCRIRYSIRWERTR